MITVFSSSHLVPEGCASMHAVLFPVGYRQMMHLIEILTNPSARSLHGPLGLERSLALFCQQPSQFGKLFLASY